ncbi:Poly(A) RNA polymerase, mitochondrial [Nymphon striatum]|nr:Poly(A) RNA polymerase, mitochondrial [Nymphon striatum]
MEFLMQISSFNMRMAGNKLSLQQLQQDMQLMVGVFVLNLVTRHKKKKLEFEQLEKENRIHLENLHMGFLQRAAGMKDVICLSIFKVDGWYTTDNSDVEYEPIESDNETIDSYESDDVLSVHEDDSVMLSDSWKRIADIFSDCRPNSLPELVRNFSGINPALNCNANNSILENFKKFITNDINDQIIHLLESLSESEENLQNKRTLCSEITSIIEQNLGYCTVLPFGSSMTGLGMKNCDFDMHINFNMPIDQNDKKRLKTQQSSGLAENNHLVILRRIFSALLPWFNFNCIHYMSIESCHTPIIKFTHMKSRVNCDIAVKTSYGVKNTILLENLINHEPRIRPVVFAFKYWFKHVKLIGQITSYAVCMLAIFYLQSCKEPVLPKIEDIVNWKVRLRREPEKLTMYSNVIAECEDKEWAFKVGEVTNILDRRSL